MSNKVNLKDVALAIGVSTTTVHDALYGRGRVSAGTREAIQTAARKMGYRPNRLARSLKMKQSRLLGVVSNLFSTLFSRMLPSIEETARAQGYHVLYGCSHRESGNQEQDVIELLRGSGMDGLLLFPAIQHEDAEKYRPMVEGLPTVMLEPAFKIPGFDAVGTDHVQGGYLAGAALIQSGCRKLAFLTPAAIPPRDWWVTGRMKGIAQAARENGLPFVVLAPSNAESGVYARYEAADLEQFLSNGHRLEGLLAANDVTAFSAINALRRHGIDVPQDVAVIGCDDLQESQHFSPRLSSLRQPMEQIGAAAANILIRRLKGEEFSPAQHLLPPTLVERESSQSRPPR